MLKLALALIALSCVGIRAQDAPPPLPAGVELVADIAYQNDSPAQKLDLYLPKKPGSGDLRSAIVFVHGGGWRNGDKAKGQFRELPAAYAADGFVAISVNYRLSEEASFPAQVHDVKAAVRWLRANAKKYQVDPQHFGAYGNSAGAHLVTMLALVRDEDGLEGGGPNQSFSSAVQAVVPSATPTDFAAWPVDWDSLSAVTGLLGGPLAESREVAREASPVSYVRADAPPLLFIHGTADRTVPKEQTDRLVAKLREAGAKEVRYMIFEGEGHGVFQSQKLLTYPAMRAFFDDKLRKK